MNPNENPVHYCYGCQYCLAEMLEDDNFDEDTAIWERQRDYVYEDSD